MKTIRAIKIIIFVIILVMCLNRIYDILSWKEISGVNYSSMESLYELEEDLIDVLFLGSSRCYNSINNSVIWKEHGFANFSLALSGQDLVSAYHCLVEALKTQTPEVVCLEVFGTLFHGYLFDSNLYRNTLPFKISYNSIQEIMNISGEEKGALLLKWPIIHTRYAELTKEDFATNLIPYVGYNSSFYTQEVVSKGSYLGEEVLRIGEEEEKWLKKIIDLTETRDIELVFFIAPYICEEDEYKKLNYVENIASDYNIPFINMVKMQDELGINKKTDFVDSAHMNYYGAQKVSNYMGDYLKANYDLKDRRLDDKYDLWNQDAKARQHEYLNYMLANTYSVKAYFELLMDMEDYNIIISAKNVENDEELLGNKFMEKYKINEYKDKSKVWYINEGEIVAQYKENAVNEYQRIGNSDLIINCDDNIDIIIDKQSYIKVRDGINVIVYDNIFNKVVDAVGIDADNYEIVR